MIGLRRPLRTKRAPVSTPGLISDSDLKGPHVRWALGGVHVLLMIFLLLIGLGPILWLVKSAFTPTPDIYSYPMELFPGGSTLSNIRDAWTDVNVGHYFLNAVKLSIGSWLVQIVVAATGGYVLSVLRPRYAPVLTGLLLGTLLLPPVVLIIPLYLEIVDPPLIDHSFSDSYWAIWLPAGASAFNVILVKRFFDNLPRALFEAAELDGAGPYRMFFLIVLPLSKPILGVVSIFAILAEYRNFLWPYVVLFSSPEKQPISVRLIAIQSQTTLGVLMAAMLIASILPIVGFLIFQRSFIRGTGLGGALRG